jgi:glycosyltransferase involved in cell wall biosynthesis
MKVRFVTPPKAKQAGGIENAVEGLREALAGQGIKVLQGGDAGDGDAVHHFHGLWDLAHSRLAAQLRKQGRPYVVSPHGMLEPWAFRHRRWKKLPYFWLIEHRFLAGARALFGGWPRWLRPGTANGDASRAEWLPLEDVPGAPPGHLLRLIRYAP